MIGLLQRANETAVAEDKYADWYQKPQRYRQDVERRLQPAVGSEKTVFQHEVSRRSLTVRRRAYKGDDGEGPQGRQLDEYGNGERCDDGKSGGRYTDEITSVKRPTDDHVSTHGDYDCQPRVRLGAGVLNKRTVYGCQYAHLFAVRERCGVVVSTARNGQGCDTAEQVGDGQSNQPSPRSSPDLAPHCGSHATLAHDHYRHDVADDAKPAERWDNNGRNSGLQLVDSRTR